MKKVFSYLKGYKTECVLGPLFKLLEASFELLVPLIVAMIIDKAIPASDNALLIKLCIALVGLGLVGFISAVTAQYFAARAACGFAKDVKGALFSHVQTLSHTELDELGSSTLITRMTSDANGLQTGVNMAIRLLLRSPFVVFGAMIMALVLDVKMGLVFVVAIPLLAIATFAIILSSIPLYKKLQEKLDKVLTKTRENLSGARAIRAFNLENNEREQFVKESNELNGLQKFSGKISALTNPITLVILNIAIIVLIYTGAIRVDAGLLSQGVVIAIYNYMTQILIELIKLANLVVTLTKAVASAKRISAVLEIENSMINGERILELEGDYEISFEGVGLKYKGANLEAVEDLSFTVKKGETVGVIGGTGAGKSTLINLIPRFYDATSGEVKINGVNVKEYDVNSLRSKIGVVPQKAVLFKGTIRDNLKWANGEATDEDIISALEICDGKKVVLSKEGGLDAVVEQNGGNFSGGQRQRLTLARALVGKPEILILDDSYSALDYATEKKVKKAIKKACKNKTVFIVSQRISSIINADKIIVLEDGKMVGFGNHETLLESCEEYKETYQMQTAKEVAL